MVEADQCWTDLSHAVADLSGPYYHLHLEDVALGDTAGNEILEDLLAIQSERERWRRERGRGEGGEGGGKERGRGGRERGGGERG